MVFFALLAAVLIIGIAAASLRWVNTRLSVTESSAVYDIEEAADFAAGKLPDEVNARLDRDQLMHLLGLHLAFLRQSGIATFGGVDEVAMAAASTGETVVAHEDEAVDFVLAHLRAAGDDTAPVDVVVIVELSNQYLDAIGALGPSIALNPED